MANNSHADELYDRLCRDGFCVARAVQPGSAVTALAKDLAEPFESTPFCEGGFYGSRTKRFGSLLRRSGHAAAFVQHETILAVIERVLLAACDRIQLNLTQAIEIHPGAPAQFPHRDQDMWQAEKGKIEYMVNVMWPITPYTAENGATVIWPASHGAGALDPSIPEKRIFAECNPGDALLFLGSTLHGAGENRSAEIRRGMIVSYCLGWLKPYENQWLVYPPAVARRFTPDLAALVGYRQHRPNLGNYEGQCPSILLGSHVPDNLGAIDELRPDQQAELAAFVAQQARSRERDAAGQ